MNDSVTSRLKSLRERAGLSMAAIARQLGFRNASSYQRYEDPELFTRDVLPLHIVQKLARILPGKGSPPITDEEVTMLAGLSRLTGPQLRFIDEQGWVWCIGEVAAGLAAVSLGVL